MFYTFHFLAIFSLVATIFSSLRISRWWVSVWDVMRVHLAWVMFLLLMGGLIFLPLNELWVRAYLIILTAAIVYHLKLIIPFMPFGRVEVERTTKKDFSLKFLTANVREKNNQYQNLIDLVHKMQPDILLLTEANQDWFNATTVLKKQYPHVISQPQENTYGMLFFSKFPLENSEVKFLVEKDVPSIHTHIQFKDKTIQFLALHPRPPAPSNSIKNKNLELIKVAEETNWNNLPTIVGGDLNDVGWSKITQKFKQISGLLDPRVGRGFFNTYNATIPIFRVPIDHFFVSKEFKLLKIKRLEKIGSDHFPVLLEINLEQ